MSHQIYYRKVNEQERIFKRKDRRGRVTGKDRNITYDFQAYCSCGWEGRIEVCKVDASAGAYNHISTCEVPAIELNRP